VLPFWIGTYITAARKRFFLMTRRCADDLLHQEELPLDRALVSGSGATEAGTVTLTSAACGSGLRLTACVQTTFVIPALEAFAPTLRSLVAMRLFGLYRPILWPGLAATANVCRYDLLFKARRKLCGGKLSDSSTRRLFSEAYVPFVWHAQSQPSQT